MSLSEHFYLNLSKEVFTDRSFRDRFLANLKLPKHTFPSEFNLSDENYFVGGYFVCWNQKISPEDILSLCRLRRWIRLSNLVADFLIIFTDFRTREIFVLVDQFGKFPSYFSTSDNKLVLSTNFGLVKQSLVSLSLNIGAALDYVDLVSFISPTDETIVKEINQIPPGTLLSVSPGLSFSLSSQVRIDDFLSQKFAPYSKVESFIKDFQDLLEFVIGEKLSVLKKLLYAADFSSGLDSSLICYLLQKISKRPFTCYSMIAPAIRNDTDPRILSKIAEKHDLFVQLLRIDKLFPLSKFSLEWVKDKFYPATHAIDLEIPYLQRVADDGFSAIFEGIGGDEIYGSDVLDKEIRYLIQYSYFLRAVRSVQFEGIGRLLTKSAIKIILDRARFVSKKYYPTQFSPSAVYTAVPNFGLHWETNVWPITPFIDPRLVRLARSIPQGLKAPIKHSIWKGATEIFVEEQFRQGAHMGNLVRQFIRKRKRLIISILSDSLLAQRGFLKATQILKNLQGNNYHLYEDEGVYMYLLNILYLEDFIQQNNIKI